MGKWEPVKAKDLKPGDKFKAVRVEPGLRERVTGLVSTAGQHYVEDSTGGEWTAPLYQWFRRKPAKPTRPAEPPAGTVVRNTRSGVVGKHFAPLNDDDTHNWALLKIDGDSEWKKWDDWIAPTDEIEVAEWVKP